MEPSPTTDQCPCYQPELFAKGKFSGVQPLSLLLRTGNARCTFFGGLHEHRQAVKSACGAYLLSSYPVSHFVQYDSNSGQGKATVRPSTFGLATRTHMVAVCIL